MGIIMFNVYKQPTRGPILYKFRLLIHDTNMAQTRSGPRSGPDGRIWLMQFAFGWPGLAGTLW